MQHNKTGKWIVLALVAALLLVPTLASAHGGGSHDRIWQLHGVLTAMPADGRVGEWAIDNEVFFTTSATTFDETYGELHLGAYVHAAGVIENGKRIAQRLETRAGFADADCRGEATWRLYGVVDAMPTDGLVGEWTIAGNAVTATDATKFREQFGPLQVGAYVVSAGCLAEDGSRIAAMIGTLTPHAGDGDPDGAGWHLFGVVDAMPEQGLVGVWTIAGESVQVTETTLVDDHRGPVSLGAVVHAVGYYDADDNRIALRIAGVSEDDPGGGMCQRHCDGETPR